MKNTYHGVFDLDLLPGAIKVLNWGFCYIIATVMAVWGIYRALATFSSSPIATFLQWLSVISPICISVAWLRLTGVRWRYALLLFIFVPVTAFGILYSVLFFIAMVFND